MASTSLSLSDRDHLIAFLNHLQTLTTIPKNMQVAECGGLHFVSIAHSEFSEIISEQVYQGVSETIEVATLKAYVEFVERKAFKESFRAGESVAIAHGRSDGFAGFPTVAVEQSEAARRARENARLEALERYVWCKWWDNPEIAFKILKPVPKLFPCIDALYFLDSFRPVRDVQLIFPTFSGLDDKDSELIIALAWFDGGGCITGGAAGKKGDRSDTVKHAVNELVRHIVSLGRFQNEKREPSSFYHQRLLHFGCGAGDLNVKERLVAQGTIELKLPALQIDQEVKHSLADICIVWRCLFNGQPEFMGGDLARLCI